MEEQYVSQLVGISKEFASMEADVRVAPVSELSDGEMGACLDLIDSTLSEYYLSLHGPHWKQQKLDEMDELGLVYLTKWSNTALVAFMSYMITKEEGAPVLYLYEIHVSPTRQRQGHGSKMLRLFHEIASRVSREVVALESTMLTVFPGNRAAQWYFQNGYELAPHSPTDKTLRSGKVIKPDYYILAKKL